MISRRLLRIKALMALYAYNRREDGDLARAETELMFSIEKTYDLFHYLLLLTLDIADIASEKTEQALRKNMPTPEDLNPNRRFIDSPVIQQLRNNEALKKYLSKSKISWSNYPHIPRILYSKMLSWAGYEDYMKMQNSDYQSDKKFIIRLISEFLASSEDLLLCLEEQSIYWNDDIDYVIVMVEKTLRKFKAGTGETAEMVPLFKNSDDEEFVKIHFRKAVLNDSKCSAFIDNNTTNWEVDRIALMDILVMKLAITEIMEFPQIPVKVTLNEYIEISKFYCTSKSSTFVNGILDKIVREIRTQGLYKKTGRGLVGEKTDEE